MTGARDELIDLEHLSDEDLGNLQEEFQHIQAKHGGLIKDDLAQLETELKKRKRERHSRH
jgi:hypothetical protein